ncbi:LysM peptidoglycan-binding domain-containing protein [Ectopseudomonas hydrolytica]|uniref:LysM peptidoglycan-binding domain-containing protein n=1 Tax=Ectopseudomonas hydrolytica TaxID=2493633 RepID=UPI0020B8F686|nr:LysM domain-containing protein [Pseudomonas hydrolytica]UTH31602.1 LysM peptidoglycan-binding domain-containing protein [Pseudomonas hydrolytica]
MSNTKIHTVQNGDTLGAIAQQHATTTSELQRLNPIIRDPNVIHAGWKLKVPDQAAANEARAPAPGQPKPQPLPPAQHSTDESSSQTQCTSQCQDELVDVAHITGDSHYYVLNERQAQALKREIQRVQTLMDELQQKLAQAAERVECLKERTQGNECNCSRCIKQAWNEKAEQAGLVLLSPPPQEQETAVPTTEEDIQGQLRTLQDARNWYESYTPVFSPSHATGNLLESNWRLLRQKKLAELDAEIATLRARLRSEPGDSGTLASGTRPDLAHGRGRSTERERGTRRRSGVTVIEVALFSQPDRRYYISTRFREREDWKLKVSSTVLAGKPFGRQLAKDLLDDIRKEIGEGRKSSPIGALEAKLVGWTSKEDNLLNALHKETNWASNPDDSAPYATSAEAHALRFAASASAGVNNWNPTEGNIEVGAKASAAFSLAEGSVSLTSFFPSQGGHPLRLRYRNAAGQQVDCPLGVIRLQGKVELSCFVGAHAQASAGVTVRYKPGDEGAGGATALLGSPHIEPSRGGNIGLKGDAFAGAQAGGALSGALQWVDPSNQGRGAIVRGQSNASSSWSSLAEIKAEASAAFGAGIGGDFGITIARDRLAVNCKGRLVFGPGASGGFSTVVDLEKTYELLKLVCEALADVDYRYLLGVSQEAFNYMAWGLYQVASAPGTAAIQAFENGAQKMSLWWRRRSASMVEAENLARYLLTNRAVLINGKRLPLDKLPPQTVGPMLYVLSESYVESFHEYQEKAIVLLLSHLYRRWRHFIEALEHCSPNGAKVNAMESLNRLNRLLDRQQQQEFNRFIEQLAVRGLPDAVDASSNVMLAWTPTEAWRKRDVLIAARSSGQFDGLA